jgi:hypothetical protein
MLNNPTISNAARVLASRRAEKLGRRGLKEIAATATRTKMERYGDDVFKRIQRGEKLVPMPPQEDE